ncbi:DNA-binding transcriptional regulator AsnC [Corynebacterium urogenitale]|uniref:DNA-binding transcriptional regulator AsnC n=1 Tax=Corynebacterium urogenitale TaxID=2487892 RepID=A0A5J6ZCL7_9CORY|nr:Lrp/AsnC family transcriptional regulator [Corynebacterium urogenitale]QFQ03307.1 DNA-binding transcriptional regulator AsnC [Corynebacterium urogenitale]
MDSKRRENNNPIWNLDTLDRKLIASVAQDPAAPYSQWAEDLGVSSRTIARRFGQLVRRKIVRVYGRTLPDFGGRVAWLARIHGSPSRLGPIGVELAELETTRWVRLSKDRGEMICGIITSPSAYTDILFRLHSVVPSRDIRIHQLLTVWGEPGSVTSGAESIDNVDRKLLAVYARDGRATASAVAAELHIDAATVSRHRRKLVESGVLYFEADVHPDALGTGGDVLLWLRVSPGHIEKLGRHLRSLRVTRFVAATSGEHQIVANVVLPTAADVIMFVDGLAGHGVTHVETVPMGYAYKRSAPPTMPARRTPTTS